MREVTAYRCGHCSYTKLTKSIIKKHEAICFYNPATMSCATCFHRFSSIEFFCTIEHSEKQTTFCPKWVNADDDTTEEPLTCKTCHHEECSPFCVYSTPKTEVNS